MILLKISSVQNKGYGLLCYLLHASLKRTPRTHDVTNYFPQLYIQRSRTNTRAELCCCCCLFPPKYILIFSFKLSENGAYYTTSTAIPKCLSHCLCQPTKKEMNLLKAYIGTMRQHRTGQTKPILNRQMYLRLYQ